MTTRFRLPFFDRRKAMISRAKRSTARRKAVRALATMARRTPLRWGSTELKFLDCAWNGVAVNASTDGSSGEVQPSTGCTGCISVPSQGDGESNRDGRKYTIKSVWVSGVIDLTALPDQNDAVDMSGFVMALVLDTQANGATIVSENVFINPSSSAVSMIPQPLRNLQNSKRFKVLAMQYCPITGAYAMTDGANTASLNAQVKPVVNLSWKGNIVCDSIGTTADVASASDNAIHLIGYNAAGGITGNFYGKSRVRFVG